MSESAKGDYANVHLKVPRLLVKAFDAEWQRQGTWKNRTEVLLSKMRDFIAEGGKGDKTPGAAR